MRKLVSIILAVNLILTACAPNSYAQSIALPAPGSRIDLSPAFNPPMLKGIKVHRDEPLRFEFVLDKGESAEEHSTSTSARADNLKTESTTLINYFLAALTTPERDMWVNLSPYEKDRTITATFARTEMGRDMLAQDYLLKQISASVIYPEGKVGAAFWRSIYARAATTSHARELPINTFNKVWIVPGEAEVFEDAKAGTAYVLKSSLKVMLDDDYLAAKKNTSKSTRITSDTTRDTLRAIIVPVLTKEINEGKSFARLRQIYHSLILAAWFKRKLKTSILSTVYADKNKTAGINTVGAEEKQKIYDQYLKAFKKGVFNYIKDTDAIDVVSGGTRQDRTPRKYFAGGITMSMDAAMNVIHGQSALALIAPTKDMAVISVHLAPAVALDLAMVKQVLYEKPGAVTNEQEYYPTIVDWVKHAFDNYEGSDTAMIIDPRVTRHLVRRKSDLDYQAFERQFEAVPDDALSDPRAALHYLETHKEYFLWTQKLLSPGDDPYIPPTAFLHMLALRKHLPGNMYQRFYAFITGLQYYAHYKDKINAVLNGHSLVSYDDIVSVYLHLVPTTKRIDQHAQFSMPFSYFYEALYAGGIVKDYDWNHEIDAALRYAFNHRAQVIAAYTEAYQKIGSPKGISEKELKEKIRAAFSREEVVLPTGYHRGNLESGIITQHTVSNYFKWINVVYGNLLLRALLNDKMPAFNTWFEGTYGTVKLYEPQQSSRGDSVSPSNIYPPYKLGGDRAMVGAFTAATVNLKDAAEVNALYAQFFPNPKLASMNVSQFAEFLAVRKVVNPDNTLEDAFNPGFGGGAADVILATGAPKIYVADNYQYTIVDLKQRWKEMRTTNNYQIRVRSYLRSKLEIGFAAEELFLSKEQDENDGHNYFLYRETAIMAELESMGLTADDIETGMASSQELKAMGLQGEEIRETGDKKLQVSFLKIKKTIPGITLGETTLYFLPNTNIIYPDKYSNVLKALIMKQVGCYFEHAVMGLLRFRNKYMPDLGKIVKPQGYWVIDDQDMFGTDQPMNEWMAQKFGALWKDINNGLERIKRYGKSKLVLQNVRSKLNRTKPAQGDSVDSAMLGSAVMTKPGGIDLKPDTIPMQIQNSGQAIKFNIDPAMLEQLRNAPGFTPVIISIQPLKDLKAFLTVI